MKVLKIIFISAFVFLLLGCKDQPATKKVSFIDNLVEFSIPDSEQIVYKIEDYLEDNIHISVAAFDYSRLKNFEKESYSDAAMNIFYNSDSNKYKQLLEYLKDFDFSRNDFALFSDYNGYGSTKKKLCVNNSHKKIIINGQVVGEQIFYMPQQKLPFSTSYNFIIVTPEKLIDASLEINVLGNDIQPYEDFIIEKNGNYYWKSENTKEDFYKLLESDKYKLLPENLQLLRETKDLLLKTLIINEK